jgi:hypothetical protein
MECVRAKPPIDEQEQRRMKWASDRAVSRIYSIEEMRQYLRSAGDDEAKADDYLPQLDELTRKAGGSRALQLVDMQLRHMKTQAPSEVIYQEYTDGKLTYEVTAPRADLVRAVGMRQAQCFMPLVAFPEAPRQPAKPRSKSGQRRAHARWGR